MTPDAHNKGALKKFMSEDTHLANTNTRDYSGINKKKNYNNVTNPSPPPPVSLNTSLDRNVSY